MGRRSAALGSALFLVVAPGMVAGLVPWLLTGRSSAGPPLPVAVLGGVLVAGGLYRHVRNPMYVAVGATIVGQALLLGRPWLLAYAAVFWLVVACSCAPTRSRP